MKLVNDDAVILEETREQRLWQRGSRTPEPLANYMTRIAEGQTSHLPGGGSLE